MTAPLSDDPTPACPVCARPNDDRTWRVCAGCVAKVDRMLGELVDLMAMTDDPEALLPGASTNDAPLGGHREPPLPLRLDGLELALGEDLLGVLESWERWWREHWNLSPYGPASAAYAARCAPEGTPGWSTATTRTIVGVVGFLRRHWPIAATVIEPPPKEFADEIRTQHAKALNALRMTPFDIDPNPNAVEPYDYTVPCPSCARTIGMRRQARPIDGQPPDTVRINCVCGWHGTGEWLIRVAVASGSNPTMTLAQVMGYYEVGERTVRRWVADGRLVLRRGQYRLARHADTQMLDTV